MNSAEVSSQPFVPVPHTYRPDDVRLLIRRADAPQVSRAEKERRLLAGESYGHFLSPEAAPTQLQMQTYEGALTRNGAGLAAALTGLAAQLEQLDTPITLLSLARAGLPVGAVLRRLLTRRGMEVAHVGLSVIRGVGLDTAALEVAMNERPPDTLPPTVIFVDGWTGKGSVLATLEASLRGHTVRPRLAALYDPAQVAEFAGSRGDVLLPHAALNATVSGLTSRTFLTPAGHAADTLTHLAAHDVSAAYVDALDALCRHATPLPPPASPPPGVDRPADLAVRLAAQHGCTDPHRVKPGLGEATRAFLRRRPAVLLLRARTPDTAHLEAMAQAQGVPVHLVPALPYTAVSVLAGQPDPV